MNILETVVSELSLLSQALQLPHPKDLRNQLATNPRGKRWRRRNPRRTHGVVWHQAMSEGSVEQIALYHTGNESHLYPGGVESIAYTFAIRPDGQVIICNDLDQATWSQGDKDRRGDENKEFIAVLFIGKFLPAAQGSEPSIHQLMSGLILWRVLKDLLSWNENSLHGHFEFGKDACPGNFLKSIISISNMKKQPETAAELPTIEERQKILASMGFYRGKIDGIWGAKSRVALTMFQNKARINVDGIWGAKTSFAIKRYREDFS